MSNHFIPFAKPSIGEEEIAEVVDSMRNGWLATGPKVKQFTQMLQDYTGAPIVIPLTSGTAGLHFAMHGLNLGPEDEVLVSAFTFAATYNTVEQTGAKCVPVDVDLETLNMSISALEKAITPRTKLIVPVHFAGLPVNLDAVYRLAEQAGIRVLEDAAHAIGAEYQGKKIGGFGDIQLFSFHPNKNMTTGEGGAIALRDPELADHIAMMSFHGFDKAAWNRNTKAGTQHYDIVMPGLKANMLDIQAAMGIHQLPKLDGFIDQRTQIVNRYYDALADWPEIFLPKRPEEDVKHAYHLLNARLNLGCVSIDRDTLLTRMKEENIGLGLHYESIHLSSYYRKKYGFKPGDYPATDLICDTIFSLPLYPGLTEDEQSRVIDTLSKIIRR